MKIVYLATVLAVLVLAQSKIFPPPVVEEYHRGELTLGSVCNVFHFPSEHLLVRDGYYFGKILKRLNNNLECPRQLVFTEGLIPLKATEKNEMKDESYEIRIDQNGIEIIFGDYSGYVYALESLSQLIKKNTVPFAHIRDEPLLSYRGIMIDSARHYLSVASIKRLITSMPLSKLNILHWHIVDD